MHACPIADGRVISPWTGMPAPVISSGSLPASHPRVFEMDHLSGNGIDQFLSARQLIETCGAEQCRLRDFERAALIDQPLPL